MMASNTPLTELYIDLVLRGGAAAKAQIDRIKKNTEEMSKLYKSQAFAEYARAEGLARKVRKQGEEIRNHQMIVGEYGKVHAVLGKIQDRLKPINDAMSSWQAYAMYAAGGMGIMGAVAAASPDVYKTFTMSIQLLGAEIGKIFVPAVIEAAYWIQQAANYVRDLSPATKAAILDWAIWGVKVALTTMVVTKLIPVLMAMNSAFNAISVGGLASGFTGLLAAINPVTIALMAVAAAIALIGYNLYQIQAQSASQRSVISNLQGGGSVTRAQYEQHVSAQDRQFLEAGPDGEARNQRLQQLIDRTQTRITELEPKAAEGRRNITAFEAWRTDPNRGFSLLDRGPRSTTERGQDAESVRSLQSQRAAQEVLRAIQEGRTGSGRNQPELASTFTAQFTSFEQGWKRIQQEAASRGPVEERMLMIQEQMRMHLRNIDVKTPGAGMLTFGDEGNAA